MFRARVIVNWDPIELRSYARTLRESAGGCKLKELQKSRFIKH